MTPSDWTVALAMLLATIAVCLVAPITGRWGAALPSVLRFLSGLTIPPLVVLFTFWRWESIRGTHNSAGLLLFAWIICIIVGLIFSRRSRKQKSA